MSFSKDSQHGDITGHKKRKVAEEIVQLLNPYYVKKKIGSKVHSA